MLSFNKDNYWQRWRKFSDTGIQNDAFTTDDLSSVIVKPKTKIYLQTYGQVNDGEKEMKRGIQKLKKKSLKINIINYENSVYRENCGKGNKTDRTDTKTKQINRL